MDERPTLDQLNLMSRLIGAVDEGDEQEIERIRREIGWPLPRLLRELERAGLTERPGAVALP